MVYCAQSHFRFIAYWFTSTVILFTVIVRTVEGHDDDDHSLHFALENPGPFKLRPVSVANPENVGQIFRACLSAAAQVLVASLLELLHIAMRKVQSGIFFKLIHAIDSVVNIL